MTGFHRASLALTPLSKCCHRRYAENMPSLSAFTNRASNCHVDVKTMIMGFSTRVSSYYDVLGVTAKATQGQVKAAYYRLSKVYHPDVNPGKEAQNKFVEISYAYEVLGNKRTRQLYDQGLLNPRDSSSGHSPTGDATYEEFLKYRGRFSGKKKPPTSRTNIYDFDEYYRAHYGEEVEKHHFSKTLSDELAKEEEEIRQRNKSYTVGYILMFLGALGYLLKKKIF